MHFLVWLGLFDSLSPEYLNNLLKLEFDIDQPSTNDYASEQTQEPQIKLIDYLKGKGAKTSRQIKQNAAKLFKGISEQTIRDELKVLVAMDKVICSGDDSYTYVE